MCGRYYVGDKTAREIVKLVRQMDQRKRQDSLKPWTGSRPEISIQGRMPLILEQEEIAKWVLDDTKTESILHVHRKVIFCAYKKRSSYKN